VPVGATNKMTTRVQSHCDGGLGTRAVAEWEGAAKARQCPPRIGLDPVGSLAARLRCPIHEPRHKTPGRAQRGTPGSSLPVDLPKPKKFISAPNLDEPQNTIQTANQDPHAPTQPSQAQS
jgi:hypothetical protein